MGELDQIRVVGVVRVVGWLKMRDFALKMRDFALKMRDFASKMRDFA